MPGQRARRDRGVMNTPHDYYFTPAARVEALIADAQAHRRARQARKARRGRDLRSVTATK